MLYFVAACIGASAGALTMAILASGKVAGLYAELERERERR